MAKATKQVELNIEETKDFLRHIITNNTFLQKAGKVPITVNIEGDAGLGKTSLVRQLSDEMGISCVRVNLAEIEELGDLVGFPIRQFQLCKKPTDIPKTKVIPKQVKQGDETVTKDVTVPLTPEEIEEASAPKCMWIDEKAVDEYLKQGFEFTGEKRMTYCPPEWIVGLEDKGGILLLDDYSRADQRFIQACMTLIETQKYISWALPKNWHIMLTTNPDGGDYHVTTMDTAQKTRFISINMKFDVKVWAKWAEEQNIDGRCINFLLLHKEFVTTDVNPRSVTTFFNAISSLDDFQKSLPLIQMIGEGSVGPEFSVAFTQFINNKLDKLVTPETILLNENESYVTGQLHTCIGVGKEYRGDIASVLTTRFINFTVKYAEENTVSQKVIDRVIKLCTDSDVFTEDLKYVIIKKLVNCPSKAKFAKFLANPQVQKMALK